MKLPQAPVSYDRGDQVNMRNALQEADRKNFKKGEEVQPVRLILKDTVTGTRYLITVASGALTLTAL